MEVLKVYDHELAWRMMIRIRLSKKTTAASSVNGRISINNMVVADDIQNIQNIYIHLMEIAPMNCS